MRNLCLYTLLLILLITSGQACAPLPLEEIDRSRLNSPLMNFATYSDLDNTSPHTALRSTGGGNSSGCSVCAH